MKRDIVFVLDLSNIDSVMALEYAYHHLKDKLTTVVLNDEPKSKKQQDILDNFKALFSKALVLGESEVEITTEIPNGAYTVICCSTLGKVAEAINYQYWMKELITSGGYVGNDFYEEDVFIHERTVSDNLSNNFNATRLVLTSTKSDIEIVRLVSENHVNHRENTPQGGLWRYDELAQYIFKKYNVTKAIKLKHMLTCCEALAVCDIPTRKFIYSHGCPVFSIGMNNVKYWYTLKSKTSEHRKCFVSTGFK